MSSAVAVVMSKSGGGPGQAVGAVPGAAADEGQRRRRPGGQAAHPVGVAGAAGELVPTQVQLAGAAVEAQDDLGSGRGLVEEGAGVVHLEAGPVAGGPVDAG